MRAANPVPAGELEAATMNKVMWRVMPFIMLCYFVAYLDRTNVGFAALQMNKALSLSQAQFGFGAGLFFLTYCLCEIPSNLLLYRFGARRWLARIMFTWGLCAAGMALISNDISFYVVRALLGAAEAGFQPGVLFFLTLWFPEAYRGRVLGLFFAAIPVSGIIGAPISGFLLTLDGSGGLAGWQWLYLLEGVPAMLLAPLVLAYLRDSPADVKWLTPDGRSWLAATLASQKKQREDRRSYSILQALTNPLVWFLALIYFTNVCLNNAIATFLPQIVKSFGVSNQQTGFIAAIPSLVALVSVIWFGRRSDRRAERYGHAAFANFVGGAALLASALVQDPIARVAALSLALAGTLSFAGVFWTIPSGFLSGASAAGGLAAISAVGIIGGFVSPWFIGYLRDVTGAFRWGMGVVGCIAIVAALALYVFGRGQTPSVAMPTSRRAET
jgi:sugar phosphate permease